MDCDGGGNLLRNDRFCLRYGLPAVQNLMSDEAVKVRPTAAQIKAASDAGKEAARRGEFCPHLDYVHPKMQAACRAAFREESFMRGED